MAAAAATAEQEKKLLSSVVDDIRSYSGSDPLRPWLRGMRKMERALPPAMLREKLPRFLQKCAQEFQGDARYHDDPRYLRVWIQLMDYVTDAKPLLKKMEWNGIGFKRASFYMAFALYYEKHKRFNDAEKMYRLGIQNLAEPIGELQKAHEQFLLRIESYKRRKDKERMPRKAESSATLMNQVEGESRNCKELKSNTMQKSRSSSNPSVGCYPPLGPAKVGSALVGKSETEDACHHGLVEPTINTKEAMDAINSMFLEPVEPETMLKRRSKPKKPNYDQQASAFGIFVDEDEPKGNPNVLHNNSMKQDHLKFSQQIGGFAIFVDEDSPDGNDQNNATCHRKNRSPPRPLCDSSKNRGESDFQKPFVGGFAMQPDDEEEQCEQSDDGMKMNSRTVQPTNENNTLLCPVRDDSGTRYHEGSHPVSSGLEEDTVIHRFVGSTIDDEPKVENACHHGLVDPTVNLKEAKDDLNNMFGRPLNFKGDRTKRKANALSDRKTAPASGFSILADDDLKDNPTSKADQKNSCKFDAEDGLFEPTITTRDVMAEINDMFGMPLDF
ncbi:unnamed protein product [Miscanthus lutarioriparius]|uniref:BUB1 N-terminal domain-containing protein n=1 Tax=Miscanthus lutarioriparius TaxID=422564 RepID=A0A811QGS4_9POAL|nr:unnamed protein product [Miscanthus lutarioriparius]